MIAHVAGLPIEEAVPAVLTVGAVLVGTLRAYLARHRRSTPPA